jgi:hypothetical protein
MKRAFVILCCLGVLALGGYLAFSRWAIRSETLNLFDVARNRAVAVEIVVLRDSELRADTGLVTLPVAIISHGNTVRNTEYSFLANILAARGYLVASIQHDLPSDLPLVTRPGSLYVGRLPAYERGEQNIFFAISEMKRIQPNADYGHLTMVGHSNGGDISMFFAQDYPELVTMIVTLDNLRVPCLLSGKAKILLFRSNDWKPDPGVVPSELQSEEAGVTIVRTNVPHIGMSDRGQDSFKASIGSALDKFLSANSHGSVAAQRLSP